MELLKAAGKGALENPAGGLSKQEFMASWEPKRQTVHLCNFGWPYKKATDVWKQGFEVELKGQSGSGDCQQQCGAGDWNPVTGRYGHVHAQGSDPEKEIKGRGSDAMRYGLPDKLLKEILDAALGEGSSEGILLDVCAGGRSMQQVALDKGLKYVAIDIRDQKQTPDAWRKVEVRLEARGHVLARKRMGSWTLPGTWVNQRQEQGYAKAMEALRQQTGLSKLQVLDMAVSKVRCQHVGQTTTYVRECVAPVAAYARQPWRWVPEELLWLGKQNA